MRLAVSLFLIFLSIYLLSGSRILHVDADEGFVFATVENMAKFDRVDVEQMASVSKSSPWEFAPDGKHYSKYGLMQSLLPVPLYLIAAALPQFGNADVVLLFNPIVTALTVVVVFAIGVTLGYSSGSSAIASIIFGLGTFAWAYSKRLMGEPVSSLLLLTSMYWLLRFEKSRRLPQLALAGGFMGMAFALKVSNIVVLVAELVFLGYLLRGDRQRLRPALALALPFALFVALVGLYDYVRFGNPLVTGYGPHEGFSTPLLYGLWGLLLSPGRSVFLYSPVLVLSLVGFVVFARRHRGAAILLGSAAVLQVLLYAKWWVWWGGWNWGPRFLVPLAPVMAIWLLPLIQAARARRWLGVLMAVLFAVSFAIQILGVAVDHSVYLRDQNVVDPDVHGVTVSEWRYSPLLNQLKYLNLENLDFPWVYNRVNSSPPEVDYTSMALLAGLVLFTVACGVAAAKLKPQRRLGGALLLGLPALAVIAATYAALARANEHAPGDYRALVAEIGAYDGGPDAIVFSDYGRNEDFLNLNKSRAFVLGWGEEWPVSPALAWRLDEVVRRALSSPGGVGTVAHVTPNSPESSQNGIERLLNERGFLAETRWFGNTRLVRYLFPKTDGGSSGDRGQGSGDRPPTVVSLQRGDNLAGLVRLRRASLIRQDLGRSGSGKGSGLFVTLEWEGLTPLSQSYTVFVQLLDSAGKLVAQRDGLPVGGTLPTNRWQVGQLVEDRHLIRVSGEAPAAEYRVIVGMYNLVDGKRLPLVGSSGDTIGDYASLATVELGAGGGNRR